MPTRVREYHRPKDWAAALKLLRAPHTAPLVLGPRPSDDPGAGAEAVVDLSTLKLDYVTQSDDGTLHLGALTPLADLADLHFPASELLADAVHNTAHYGLRNVATVGGAILSPDCPSEVLLALLALDATVVIRGDKLREISLTEFVAAYPTLGDGELISELRIKPIDAGRVGAALERVARTPRDEAIVAVAAIVALDGDGTIRLARVAISGASPRPQRAFAAEKLIEGAPLSDESLKKTANEALSLATPVGDYRGSARYRKEMAGVLTRRALTNAIKPASSHPQ